MNTIVQIDSGDTPLKANSAMAERGESGKTEKNTMLTGPESRSMANDSRPPMNVYTAMLVLSFIALAIGCIFLALNLNLYEFKIMPDVSRP